MQNEAIFLIEKLLNYYNLTSLQELAEKLNIKQSSLSSWKSRNSINAIRNKCRELGIYNDIFGDLNSNININSTDNINLSNKTDIDETTMSLVKEAYKKAKNSNNIKKLRIYLMDFDEEEEIIMPPKIVEKLTLNELKDMLEDIKTKSK